MDGTANRKGIIVKGRSGDPEEFYDTFIYDHTASATQNLFQSFSGKTLDQTNMTDAGKLPTGKSQIVSSFNVYLYAPAALVDAGMLLLYEFLAKTTVEFSKENRAPSFTRTLQQLLGVCSLIFHTPTVPANNDANSINAPFFRGRMKINTRALDLGANQTFNVRQTTFAALAAGLNGLRVKYGLEGLCSKKITE